MHKFGLGFDMVICHDRKILFVHIPKTAGGSMEEFLGMFERPECLYGVQNGKALQHLTYTEYQSRFNTDPSDYFVFTVVRNPYDRLLSEYRWCEIPGIGQRHGQSLDDFIGYAEQVVARGLYDENVYIDHFQPQTDFVYQNGRLMADHVGRFEALSETIDLIREKYQITGSFPWIHGRKSDGPIGLSDQQRERIYQIYLADFTNFGYSR